MVEDLWQADSLRRSKRAMYTQRSSWHLKARLTSQVRPEDPTKAPLKTIARWRWKRYCNHYRATLGWYLAGRRSASETEAVRLVKELRENGIAVTNAERLGLNADLIGQLMKECQTLAESPHALAIGEDRHDDVSAAKKSFFFRLLGHDTIQVDRPDVFSRMALDPTVLSIANDYLRCYSRLTRYNVWLNLPSIGDPKTSQLWHRDYGDGLMLKMFLMVSSVNKDNGAFSYIPGTQLGGRRRNLDPPVINELGNRQRTLDEQMRQVVPESEWVTPTGDPGTVIFADTSGFHKGGFVRSGRRLLFKAYYTRWICMVGCTVKVNDLGDLSHSRSAKWAVRPTNALF